jgi:anaerobic selenocysteine-containing dehydrogenase
VAGVPFSLSAVPNHPLSFGTLCAAGWAAHQSAYHPSRVRTPLIISHDQPASSVKSIGLDEAKSRLASALKGAGAGAVAILDLRPGRTASLAYRKFLGTNGTYLVPSRTEASVLDAMCEKSYGPTGLDLDHAKLIVSLGAPLLEMWGSSNRLVSMPSGDRPRILQVETRRSRTATLADEWIRLKPGSETAFVLGLANVIVQNGSYDAASLRRTAIDMPSYIQLVNQYSPQRVSELTGIQPERIVELALEIAAKSPSIVVNGSDADSNEEIAVTGLNLLLGNLGREGGIISRSEVPVQSDLAESALAPISALNNIPDRSIQLLIIDDPGTAASLPWDAIKGKLSPERSFVVCFSPYLAGVGRSADLLIPTPAPFESFADIPTPPNAMNASFAVAAPLLQQPAGMADPLEILGNLFSVSGTTEQYLRGRVEAIREQGDGTVFSYKDGSTVDVRSFGTAEDLWTKLVSGALWLDIPRTTKQLPKLSLLGRGSNAVDRMTASALNPERYATSRNSRFPLTLLLFTYPGATGVGQVSPLMTKVYQESGLRFTSDVAVIDPDTAKSCGLDEGDFARLETTRGSRRMKITIDRSVMPGVIHAAAGPDPVAFASEGVEPVQDILSLVELDDGCSWKPTAASLRKAS